MAVTITAAELANRIQIDEANALVLLPVIVELVEDYAPHAPDAVSNEAACRCGGWLAEAPPYPIARTENTVGGVSESIEYAPALRLSALRHSGAMALLTRWKIRRAGAI